MKANKMQIAGSLILCILLSVSLWQNARAWTSIGTWPSNHQYYHWTAPVPPSFWTYINNSANTWTNVTPSHWIWTNDLSQGILIYYSNIDGPGGVLGQDVLFSSMTIDSSENWYAGSGVPGTGQYDVQSLVTHEFGHALGLGHTSGIYCPGNTNNATMCVGQPSGSYYDRTLEGDDRNGANSKYP